jgi:transcriptional regulator with XRE-family HTH domain/tetratricopeptide (TPR) repeat protein
MIEIGECIRDKREAKGWSQAVCAFKVGISQSTLSRIENGHTVPNYQEVDALAGALDISIDSLRQTAAILRRSRGSAASSDHSEFLASDARVDDKPVHELAAISSVRPLYGRDDEIELIMRALWAPFKRIVVLEGIAGVGKTALALRIFASSQSTGRCSFDLWISAKGRASLGCNAILDDIALRLDFPYLVRLPYDDKEANIISLFLDRPALIVLDEFENIPEPEKQSVIAMFLRFPGTCRFLVTSQMSLGMQALASEDFEIRRISGLPSAASIALLRNERQRLGIEHLVLDEILPSLHHAVAGNALALKLAIAQLRTSADEPANFVAGASAAGEDMFLYLFEKAWNVMPPRAQAALIALPLLAGHFTKDALAAIAGLPEHEQDAADDLSRLLLIEPLLEHRHLVGRFDAHQLVRTFANLKLRQSGQSHDLLARLADFHIAYSRANEVRFWEGREAYSHLEMEWPNIASTMALLRDAGEHDRFVTLCLHVIDFLIVRGDWLTCFHYGAEAAAIARKQGDLVSHAWLLVHAQGYLLANTGEPNKAITLLKRALVIYRRLGDVAGEAEAARNLGRAYRKAGKFKPAMVCYQCSLSRAEELQNSKLIALALNEIGKLKRDLQAFEEAKDIFSSALLAIGEADSSIRAGILCNQSGVSLALGLEREALDEAQRSLDFFHQIDNKEGIATSSQRLALLHRDSNRTEALRHAKRSYFEYSRLGMAEELAALDMAFGTLLDE